MRPWLFALAAVGCGPAPGDDESVAEIVIPMQPQSEASLEVTTEIVVGDAIHLDGELDLAVGEGYPRELVASVAQWGLVAECGPVYWGEIAFHELSGATDAIAAKLEDGARLRLTAHDVGEAELAIAGEITIGIESGCPISVGTTVPLTVTLAVGARRAAGARFVPPTTCGEVPTVANAVGVPGFGVTLVDDDGEAFQAANAAGDAQATVRLRGSFGDEQGNYRPHSLGHWLAPAEPGVVEVVSDLVGPPLAIDVVDATAITRAEIEFQLAGAVAEPTVLQSDVTYGEDGWGENTNRVAPMARALWAGDQPLCSPPSPAWFELESLTPAVCSVLEFDAEKIAVTFNGESTGKRARLDADGTCALQLRTPEFSPDAGRLRSLSATFRNVDEL